jgi:hypothetical protein
MRVAFSPATQIAMAPAHAQAIATLFVNQT